MAEHIKISKKLWMSFIVNIKRYVNMSAISKEENKNLVLKDIDQVVQTVNEQNGIKIEVVEEKVKHEFNRHDKIQKNVVQNAG